jgi:hypothetical protein
VEERGTPGKGRKGRDVAGAAGENRSGRIGRDRSGVGLVRESRVGHPARFCGLRISLRRNHRYLRDGHDDGEDALEQVIASDSSKCSVGGDFVKHRGSENAEGRRVFLSFGLGEGVEWGGIAKMERRGVFFTVFGL